MRERSSEEEDEKEETVLREKEEEEDVIVDICAGQGRLKFLSRGRAASKTSVTPPLLREGNSIILEVKDLCEYADDEENDDEKSKVPWMEHKFAIGDATHPEGLEEALLKM